MSCRDAKEVETPQLLGMLPDRLLLCTARVMMLSKHSVEPQLAGSVPFNSLPCRYRPWSDCSNQGRYVRSEVIMKGDDPVTATAIKGTVSGMK